MKGSRGANREDPDKPSRYGEELLAANWNPVIDLLAASCTRTTRIARGAASEELREEDAAAFLGRIYNLV